MTSNYRILKTVRLNELHRPTDFACRHTINGDPKDLNDVVQLQIQGDPMGGDVLLLYEFADGSGTDTWHEDMEDAIKSAELQYNAKPSDWLNTN
jgi:hypothetical protein